MRRYDAYVSALAVLQTADQQNLSNEFIQSGIVDKFSLQFELGWKLLKDLLRHEGYAIAATSSPRDILKVSYRTLGIGDEQTWLRMLRDRNVVMHVYDGDELHRLVRRIIDEYIPAFEALRDMVWRRYGDELATIG